MDQPRDYSDYSKAADLIRESKRVVLGGHPQMDGDALGSLLALRSALKAAGRECLCVTQDLDAGKYAFLEGADELVPLDKLPDLSAYDTCIIVDCGAVSRARAVLTRLPKHLKVVNLDHHIDNPGFGDAAVVLPNSSSSGEVVYNTLEKAGIPLTKGAAEAVVVAIMTDTGRFMFNNSTPDSFRIVAKLIERFEIDLSTLTGNVYRNKSIDRMKLEAMVAGTLQAYLNGKVIAARVSREMMDQTHSNEAEATEMIAIPKAMGGAMVSLLFRESGPTEVKVSWRSEGQIAVNEIAAMFKGGGHLRAAGAVVKGRPVAEIERDVLDTTIAELQKTLKRTGGAIIA